MRAPQDNGLRWLFLDLNSYFASVEQNEHPHLRGRPVVVVPSMTDWTSAIAASYEAKRFGIRTGTAIHEAKKLCPNLVMVLASHQLYVEYHARILRCVENYLPINKVWSIDEFDCELMGHEKLPHNAIVLANRIKKALLDEVGPSIRCSIGIAPNSFLAKVATDMQKPDGLVLLGPEALPGPLFDLKLTDLPGISSNMLRRLEAAGIYSVEQLWNTSPKHARAVWGSVLGERFWYWLHGFDFPPQETQTSMVGHSRVLDPQARDIDKAKVMARYLLIKAARRLRHKELVARNLSLSARLTDGYRWEGMAQFPAAHDTFTFLSHLENLWQAMQSATQNRVSQTTRPEEPWDSYSQYDSSRHGSSWQGNYHGNGPKNGIKKVSVILHKLSKAHAVTDDLFETLLPHQQAARDKHEKLSAALDRLQQKYRRDVVNVGVKPVTHSGDVGTKIAFARVPSQHEFWE